MRQSYLQLLSNESINVPPVMYRGMAVDYGLLRHVYGLDSVGWNIRAIRQIRYTRMCTMTRQFPDVHLARPSATTSRVDALGYMEGVVTSPRRNCGRERSGWTVGIELSLKACRGIRLSIAFLRYSLQAPVSRLITTMKNARVQCVTWIDYYMQNVGKMTNI